MPLQKKDIVFVSLISRANGKFKLHSESTTPQHIESTAPQANLKSIIIDYCYWYNFYKSPFKLSDWNPHHPIQRLQQVTHRTGVKLVLGRIFGGYSLRSSCDFTEVCPVLATGGRLAHPRGKFYCSKLAPLWLWSLKGAQWEFSFQSRCSLFWSQTFLICFS